MLPLNHTKTSENCGSFFFFLLYQAANKSQHDVFELICITAQEHTAMSTLKKTNFLLIVSDWLCDKRSHWNWNISGTKSEKSSAGAQFIQPQTEQESKRKPSPGFSCWVHSAILWRSIFLKRNHLCLYTFWKLPVSHTRIKDCRMTFRVVSMPTFLCDFHYLAAFFL